MRVLYFTERDSPHDRRFLNALAETAHQVYALRQFDCQPETPAGITELSWPGGRPDWSGWDGWEQGSSQLAALLEKVQPDLVQAGPVQGPALLAALAEFHPLLTLSWGSDLLLRSKRSPWMRLATQFTLDRTDIFLGDCQTVADAAAGFGFPRERMMLFPWGVDLAHFSPETGRAVRRSLGWEEKFIVFCNRTWAPLYGVDVLAEGFLQAAQQSPALRLVLAGGGPQVARIQQSLAPVRDRVVFPGWVGRDDLPAYYGAADLFVSPSHSDGSSISLLEALACGLPALVSDIPSNREWITSGVTGDLFRDGDPQDLAQQLLRLEADPKLPQYGEQARVLAEARADWDQNFQKLLLAYQMAAGSSAVN